MPRIDYPHVAPEAIKALLVTKTYTNNTKISPRLRALVELRVSQINGCVYCVNLHSREARQAGETQQRLDCLTAWREAPFFDEREKAALAWAESVTRIADTGVPDDVFELVRKQFNEKDLVDLTIIIGMMNTWNRIAVSFRQVPVARDEGKS